ncbi:MAG: flagellar filament capping protein FliD [Phycisphaerae bacterium]
MATFSMPGVYSSIDTNVLVEATLRAESRPLQQLEDRKSAWEKKTGAVEEIEAQLRKLRNLASDLRNIDTLRGFRAKSSDEAILTASAAAGAVQGTHEIIVNRLASSEREVHSGVASADTLVGEGAFSYTYNGVTRTVYTNEETTLEGLANLINKDSGNPGVNASILEVGGEGEQGFHLVLSGRDSGGDYTITLNDAATTLDGTNGTVDFRGSTFTETQTAQNSQLRVDGYPPTGWIERSGNTIGDVISGVTLELQGVGESRLSLTRTDDKIKQTLGSLPGLYNSLCDTVDKYTGYDEETGEGGILQGSISINSLLQRIRSTLVSRVPGFDSEADGMSLAVHLGFEFDKEGKLSLDTSTFEDALSQDYDTLLNLIGAQNRGVVSSEYIQFDSAMENTQPGAYELEIDWDAGGNITEARIRLEGETEWRTMSVSGNTLTGQLNSPEQGMALMAVFPGSAGTHEAGIRLQQGFGTILADRLDEILDSREGSVALQKQNIKDNIKRLNSQIDFQETRLETRKKHLQQKYARLEAMLARIDSMQSAFQSLFQMVEQQNGAKA